MARSSTGKLLLFDIDGTLLIANGIGRRCMDEALAELFGPLVTSGGVAFSGRTDLAIMKEVLQNHGVADADIPRLVALALKTYAASAQGRMRASDLSVLPGVPRLLDHLAKRPDVQLGLVTGNLRSTAYLKLNTVGLASLFPFGAFGNDHADRNLLPPLAIRRARAYNGLRYSSHDIVVIGDSVHDIRCGRHVGAHCVAVATGVTAAARLAAEAPDLLLPNLSDTDAFCAAVLDG